MMIALIMLATAFATGVRFEEVPCPYGDGQVRKYFKVSANTLGGYDSDLASYSTRGQFREYAVSTCPSNYFSTMGSKLDSPIPAAANPAIAAAIAASRNTWANRDDPQVWERYDTAARIARALNKAPLTIAELYLNASWTARDHAVGVYVGGLNGPEASRNILNLGAKEFDKDLTPEAIKLLRYNLARVAHRGGFNDERDTHLGKFLALTSLSPSERKAGLRMQHISKVVEPSMQRQAVMALKEGLSQPGDPVLLIRARYQMADLHRRLGQYALAARDYRAVVLSGDAPSELKVMARFLLGGIEAQQPRP
jgi:hypothetical protein